MSHEEKVETLSLGAKTMTAILRTTEQVSSLLQHSQNS